MINRRLFCCVIVVAVLFSLCACGKKNNPAATTVPTTEPPITTEPNGATEPDSTTVPPTTRPDDPNGWIIDEELQDYSGVVRFYSAFELSLGMQDMIEAFNEVYPNIEIDYSWTKTAWGGGHELEFDVIQSYGMNYTTKRWQDGYFVDITDKLTAEGIDLVENWGTDAYSYNSRYYSIPCGGLQYYITINMTAWEEAELGAIPTEWTWDEYIEACRKMTKTNDDGSIRYGGSSYSSINTILYCGTQVSGRGLYFNEDGTKSNYDDPVVIKAFERELKAELEDQIWFPLYTYRSEGQKEYDTFLNGECASTITINVVRYVHDAAYEETSDFITAFAPFPTEEKGQTNYMAGVHVYSHVGITKDCRDETAAWLFVKWVSTYGSKYLCVHGHQSAWRGTTTDDIINVVFGSEENAAKYVDVESFKNVIGKTDLPAFREIVSDGVVETYSQVTSYLKDPLMKALMGELTAEEALKQAAENADAYIKCTLEGK